MSLAPAAHVENKRSEREGTGCPPAVEEKKQPLVSSSPAPTTRSTPPVNPAVNSPAPPRPPPDPTQDEDKDYDSDDASKPDRPSQTEPPVYRTWRSLYQMLSNRNSSLCADRCERISQQTNKSMCISFRGKLVSLTGSSDSFCLSDVWSVPVLFFLQPRWDVWSSACCTSRRITLCTAALSKLR